MSDVIRRLEDTDLEAVVAFSLNAWAPVFASLEAALGPNVYGLLFPDWRSSQANAIEATCKTPENDVWVAVVDGRPVGFVAVGLIDEDATRAGEIHMIAVDPAYQGAGVGASLMQWAITQIKARGVELAVVATGGPRTRPRPRPLREVRLQPSRDGAVLPDAVIALAFDEERAPWRLKRTAASA